VNHIAYDMAPTPAERAAAVAGQLRLQRENRAHGRPLDHSKAPIRTLERPLLPLFLAASSAGQSSSSRLNACLQTALAIDLDDSQLHGVGYVLGRHEDAPLTINWSIAEKSYMEAFRSLHDISNSQL
jgi:hypothetical protein